MANWNRVWGQDGSSCSSAASSTCPSSCYNFVDGAYDPSKSILNDFCLSVHTVSEAMVVFARSLASRLGVSNPVINASGDTNCRLSVRMSRRADDVATINMQFSTLGSYPIQCTLNYGVDESFGSFGSLMSLEDWIVSKIQK